MDKILRQVYIYKGTTLLYHRHFGKALKQDVFSSLVKDLMGDAFAKGGNQVEYHDYYKYRISYITEKDQEIIFLFVTGLTDNFENIKKELIKCKKEFLNLFEDILQHKFDKKTFEVFDPTIDGIHRNLRPKISLVGFSGVGKTTITRLIKAEEIPMQHIPTITGDIATIKIGKLHFHLWDFAGQEQFSYLWNNFIKGSDAALLITDSSLENVEKSKFFLELIKEQAPNAHSAVIGNKQDLDEAMPPEQIEKILGLKTYSMIAKEPSNRDKMITIIADILEMSAEVSPLLKPLLERDTLTEQATNALENAEFQKAAGYFEKISDLCIELGDDSLGKEFYEKAQKIRSMLQSVSPSAKLTEPQKIPSPEPVKPTEKTIEPPPPLPPKKLKVPEPVEKPSEPPSIKPIEKEELPVSEEAKKITPEPKPTEESESVKVGLDLKPEDFMIKQRPKTVTTVPKDAKAKLKTSPFAQVSNASNIEIPKPVAPLELIKKSPPKVAPPTIFKGSEKSKQPENVIPQPTKTPPTPPITTPKQIPPTPPITAPKPIPPTPPITTPKPTPPTPPITAPKPTPQTPPITTQSPINPTPPPATVNPTELIKQKPVVTPTTTPQIPPIQPITQEPPKPVGMDPSQKAEIEKSLLDLKVKKANLSKMALDFDMKELTGEITGEELEKKKKKLSEIEANLNKQIEDLEKLLKS